MRTTLYDADIERYLRWVAFRPVTDQCWLWTGDKVQSTGYGRFYANRKQDSAHVILKEIVDGPCPDGYERDHLCHNADLACAGGRDCLHRLCVRPSHIEYVTPAENRRRSVLRHNATHCRRGHLWTPDNTYTNPTTGKRRCQTCYNAAFGRWSVEHSDQIKAHRRERTKRDRERA